MTTVIRGPRPPEVEAWLERRRALGLDLYDEVWEGVYVVAPVGDGRHGAVQVAVARVLLDLVPDRDLLVTGPVSIGRQDDHRVPDGAVVRRDALATWNDSALLVVEVLSPDDDTFRKVDFYAARGIAELLAVDPVARTVRVLDLQVGGERDDSAVLGVTAAELEVRIDWA